ncbi:hypothetical protein K470DRAFT_228609 [Piedraia hortae CBS 480.64]|uniref:Ubiquinol-cytochrome c chaperone domain-containing protein n=1 Tax=Piedraia hortae CBS 480.64 TaxID=1314780 RepID=A0A6A7C4W9_9PEZI|nr:hypothetical protein K470DRAFT_228609 [Piedraia hortae CBS 480.64]
MSEPYMAYSGSEQLFSSILKHCNYHIPARHQSPPEAPPKNAAGEDVGVGEGWWFETREKGGLGLEVTFNAWSQVMMLYLWALAVRVRAFSGGKDMANTWHQQLIDRYFWSAEERMEVEHNLTSRSVRNKYLKEMWQQWRARMVSLEEGLIKDDAVLAAAVWRGLFSVGDAPDTNADIYQLALITAWLRCVLSDLQAMPEEQIMLGQVEWRRPDDAAIERVLDV